MTAEDGSPHRIELTVPLHTQFAATVRLLATSLGADAGFTIDEIEDLRLGINEIFVVLAEQRPDADARTTFELGQDELVVTMQVEPGGAHLELDALADNILRSVVDRHSLAADRITVWKRATESAAGG